MMIDIEREVINKCVFCIYIIIHFIFIIKMIRLHKLFCRISVEGEVGHFFYSAISIPVVSVKVYYLQKILDLLN